MTRRLSAMHLRPAGGWFGDPIPFYWDGVYHLFYLIDREHHALPGGRHTWGHFSSADLVHWEEHPVAIPLGAEGDVDSASCGTGAVVEKDGLFHLYYLGRYFSSRGERRETMCHATSRDLITWEKDPANPISRPDPACYRPEAWRDGYVFRRADAVRYEMLVTAQLQDAQDHRCGCLALLSSPDLWQWRTEDLFWQPHLVPDMECPDLFEWNGWWYLLYSTSGTGQVATHYRRARSPRGPWEAPPVDTFDGPLLYAAKTAGDARRRILFGWVPTRVGDVDDGRRQWGGHGTYRELVQDADGLLWVRLPPEVESLAGDPITADLTPRVGDWEIGSGRARASATDGFAGIVATGLPGDLHLRARFRPDGAAGRFGLLIRTDGELGAGYEVSIDLARGRLTMRPFGGLRRTPGEELWRPLAWDADQPVEVTAIAAGSLIEVFVQNRIALVGRFHDHQGGAVGLFVEGCGGAFDDVVVRPFAQDG